MKATGIVRRFDENGRFVIPMELRKQLGLDTRDDALEVFVEDDKIILKKYAPSCVFCGSMDELATYKDKKICAACAGKIGRLCE
ncbi:MAG: AbrB/MazE/SpoVT family DNA-binding domain-containing protein [Clostridia bacterium]|nr:AbrB/MazE/SpoVT family DNA-binding domain-containing protein [Clostridia bacterium]